MEEDPTRKAQDYLKTILVEAEKKPGRLVLSKELSSRLAVTPGTVTAMLKNLEKQGLIDYVPRKGCRLTTAGVDQAEKLLRKHRLLETFMVHTLEMEREEVHREAEQMEHEISDYVADKLDVFLGHPATDPHGSIIPKPRMPEYGYREEALGQGDTTGGYRIVSVDSGSEEIAAFFSGAGINTGAEIRVIHRSPQAGTVTIRTRETEITLSAERADQITAIRIPNRISDRSPGE